MFDYHGWVTVRTSAGEEDDVRLRAIAEQIAARAAEVDDGVALIDVRWINGYPQVHVGGLPNHRGSAEDVLDLFGWIGSLAPGSYGLLYYWDDEDPRGGDYRNQYRVLVMTRGTVEEHADRFLSPCEPTIDDPVDVDGL